jgi:Spy/CpxP family protein refolding chaperone
MEMKKRNFRNLILIIATVSLVGVGATAFADRGRGGWDRGAGYGRGTMMDDLTDEQVKAMQDERNAFRKETESIRRNLTVKELELRTELARENPDAKKALALQKEISLMESDLDQKRIEHMLKMQKITPYAGRGYMMGRGGRMGYGPESGRGGYGHRGGGFGGKGGGYSGPCWQ